MNVDDYDGLKLNNEIKRIFKKVSSQTTRAKYIKAACVALGFKERLRGDNGSEIENKAIVKWLFDNANELELKLNAAVLPQIPETPAPATPIEVNELPPAPKPKTRNKTKRENRFNQFTGIAFNVTGKTGRQYISLEPEFIKALELIAPTNRNKWLSDTVSDYIVKNGIESTTRIIKSAIVNELLKRAKVKK